MRMLPLIVALMFIAKTVHAEKGYPYDDSRPVPPGFHVEERPRIALAITGGAILATGVGFFAWGMVKDAEDRRAYERTAADPGLEHDSGGTVAKWFGGVVAAVGLPLLIVGVATKKSVVVRDSVSVAPVVTPSFGGLALTGSF